MLKFKRELELVIISVLLLVSESCKSVSVLPNKAPIKNITTKVLTNKFNNSRILIKNFRARVKVDYNDQKRKQQLNLNIRLINNKAIWISANMLVPIAKILITPEEVSFFEKFQKNYFQGNISLINNKLGTNFKFIDIQNLLIGNPISDLGKIKLERISHPQYYVLTPLSNENIFKPTYFFDPTTFLLKEQRFILINSNQSLTIKYNKHQVIDGEKYPKEIEISFYNGKNYLQFSLQFLKVDFPLELSIPFLIPEGYNKIDFQ